jgi:type IV pilus assembly protein PilY1
MRSALIKLVFSIMAACLLMPVQAQVAQFPLLTQSTSVEPNLVFVFDDSGSMAANYMYQFGDDPGGMGMANPGGTEASKSPDVNMMYYDPRIQYQLPVKADRSNKDVGPTGSISSFNVYFYSPAGSTTKRVQTVTVSGSGCGTKYPTPTIVTFSKPPAGGVQATGTASVSGGKVTGVTVTNKGSGYTNTATITLSKTSGKSCKPKVTMENDPSPASVNQKWNGTGSVASLSNFFNPSYTPDAGSPLAAGATVVAYPNTASSSVTTYPKFAARNDCTGNTCTWTQELQNYANWKLYHSTRVLLARTGISLAFKSYPPYDNLGNELPAPFRLGWGAINRIENSPALDAGVSLFTQTRKNAFYAWLDSANTNPSGDTPNRLAMDRVGQYFSRSDSDGPWGTNPSYTSTSTSASTTGGTEAKTSHASCRRSNVLLLTDGYWNGSSSSLGNIDNTNGPTISGSTYKYVPIAPFKDSTSNTLADVAMKYWVTDLRTDLANNVPTPIGVSYPTWQNVTFYGIGLGIYGTLEQTPSTLAQLTSGAISWPAATANTPSAIDDLWHAAINSGGAFLNAGDADSLTNSIGSMMATISKISSSQSGVAVSGADLNVGTRKYTPQYTTGQWTGNVKATNLDPSTGNELNTAWQVVSTDAATGDVTDTIPNPNDRKIVVGNGASSGAKAVDFTYSAMSAAGLTSSMTGTVNENLINYLRGDASNEGDAGIYRTREATLGDIVNSSPVFVKSSVDLFYDQTAVPGNASYAAYLVAKRARTEGVVFVGANDGMLHAFRDGPLNEVIATGNTSVAGDEIFAYVPRAVLPNLHVLADKNYGKSSSGTYAHRYFVDGPLIETDAYFGSAWANVLVGTTGAGAKSVFAIQVPTDDPLTVSGSNLLWEISSTSTGFGELGHVLSKVQTGVLPSGEWVAIFGNGYASTSGSAQLFVVNLQTGALIQKIDTVSGPSNGLGGVALVTNSTTGRIVGAYAGDLRGNLWKFDLSSATSGGGVVGLSGTPLLALGVTQPITAAPAVIMKSGNFRDFSKGYVVSVGTGKFFESSDLSTTTQQSIYGVWDSDIFGSTTASTTVAITTANKATKLVKGVGSVLTQIPVDWSTKRGWYIDLGNSTSSHKGERVVYPVTNVAGTYIAVDAISPSNVSTNACTQSGQGTAWSYVIEVLEGKVQSLPEVNIPPDYIADPLMPTPAPRVPAGPPIYVTTSSSAPTGDSADTTFRDNLWKKDPNYDGKGKLCKIDGFYHLVRLDGNVDPIPLNLPCTYKTAIKTVVKRQWRQLFMR